MFCVALRQRKCFYLKPGVSRKNGHIAPLISGIRMRRVTLKMNLFKVVRGTGWTRVAEILRIVVPLIVVKKVQQAAHTKDWNGGGFVDDIALIGVRLI